MRRLDRRSATFTKTEKLGPTRYCVIEHCRDLRGGERGAPERHVRRRERPRLHTERDRGLDVQRALLRAIEPAGALARQRYRQPPRTVLEECPTSSVTATVEEWRAGQNKAANSYFIEIAI